MTFQNLDVIEDRSEATGKLEECAMANIAQLHRRALDETRSVVARTRSWPMGRRDSL